MEKIAVLDSGGQYCHLIARKVRELGVYAEILPIGVAPSKLKQFNGIILSGGPASVFAMTVRNRAADCSSSTSRCSASATGTN